MQAETLNGNKDDDGCPDPGAEIVRLVPGKIEVDERIGFASHGRQAAAQGELGAVA